MPADRVHSILVVTAHPDDVDFGAAGTVARWVDCGIDVHYCIVTDGDAGGFDPSVSRSAIAGIRRAEQTAAAKAVGVNELSFLGFPDGRLEATLDLRRAIARVIRTVRPDRVVCQSPDRNWGSVYGSHPDHRAAGQATLDAVYPDARNRFSFPELLADGLEPHAVGEVWVMTHSENNRYSEISSSFDRKLAALLCHASQHEDPAGLEARLRGWNGANARAAGLGDDRLAEAFFAIDTR